MKTLSDPMDLPTHVSNMSDPLKLIGANVTDRTGKKVGTVGDVYLDDETGAPEWATLHLSSGKQDVFIPLTTCEPRRGDLQLPYDRSLIESAPSLPAAAHLSPAEEMLLYGHYKGHAAGPVAPPPRETADSASAPESREPEGSIVPAAVPALTGDKAEERERPSSAAQAPNAVLAEEASLPPVPLEDRECDRRQDATEVPRPASPGAAALHDMPPLPTAGQAHQPSRPVELTCHEEKIDISTEWHTLGKVSVRRFTVSKDVHEVVPLVRERIKVERFPISAAEGAWTPVQHPALDLSDTLEEVTIREQRAVVQKRLVPIEQIRLSVEQDTVPYTVQDKLHKEQIEIQDTTTAVASLEPS